MYAVLISEGASAPALALSFKVEENDKSNEIRFHKCEGEGATPPTPSPSPVEVRFSEGEGASPQTLSSNPVEVEISKGAETSLTPALAYPTDAKNRQKEKDGIAKESGIVKKVKCLWYRLDSDDDGTDLSELGSDSAKDFHLQHDDMPAYADGTDVSESLGMWSLGIWRHVDPWLTPAARCDYKMQSLPYTRMTESANRWNQFQGLRLCSTNHFNVMLEIMKLFFSGWTEGASETVGHRDPRRRRCFDNNSEQTHGKASTLC